MVGVVVGWSIVNGQEARSLGRRALIRMSKP